MVTICPSLIRTLMTSAALTDILWASSPTVIVSGTGMWRTTGSAGGTNAGCCCSLATGRCRATFGWCHPPPPPAVSPRVLIVRRLAPSSRHTVTCLTGFFALRSAPAPAVFALCKVVSAPGAGCAPAAAAFAASAARCSASRCSASLRSRSCFSASSAAWRAVSSSWRRFSASRSSVSRWSITGAGAGGASGTSGTGGAAVSAASRLTKTRFLRTST